ncbi:MAG: hypothetical protein IKY33_03780 [Clostridia bacterium]|nr:hypothetical protein [Clostridia bacterium]
MLKTDVLVIGAGFLLNTEVTDIKMEGDKVVGAETTGVDIVATGEVK